MSFFTDVIKKDARFDSIHACNDMALLEPGFRAKVDAFIVDAKAIGHTLVPVETYRSQARQQYFYQKHLTHLRTVGVHHFGGAVDLALMDDGHYHADGGDYMFFVGLAERHGIVSGIDWGLPEKAHSFRDFDHLQAIPLFRQNQLFDGSWYWPYEYDPYRDTHYQIAGI